MEEALKESNEQNEIHEHSKGHVFESIQSDSTELLTPTASADEIAVLEADENDNTSEPDNPSKYNVTEAHTTSVGIEQPGVWQASNDTQESSETRAFTTPEPNSASFSGGEHEINETSTGNEDPLIALIQMGFDVGTASSAPSEQHLHAWLVR